MPKTLHDFIPKGERPGNDVLLGRFLDCIAEKRLQLYPAQEEAILALYEEKNVILNTPTGSGKSLVAAALHFKSVAQAGESQLGKPLAQRSTRPFFRLAASVSASVLMAGKAARIPEEAQAARWGAKESFPRTA